MSTPRTEDQVKVYEAMVNIRLKIASAIVILAVFIGVFVLLACCKTLEMKIVYGALDGILAGTMYPLTRHFFPAFKEARGN
jgi:hypothetical protein